MTPLGADDLPLGDERTARYLDRLGIGRSGFVADAEGLATLSRAHLVRFPFENLDVVHAGGVVHDLEAVTAKIVDRGQGGWCFELNGAFARLLASLGYDVLLLGCAVLLDGPSTVIEHLALEVSGGPEAVEPHLVDVGFGESFVRPLRLNTDRPQDGGDGTYALLPSPQGTTMTKEVDGVPDARLRFKRVAHSFGDFAAASHRLQTDPALRWSRVAFATRLLTDGDATPGRVTLRGSNLKVLAPGSDEVAERTVTADEWSDVVRHHFPMLDADRWPPPGNTDG